MYFIYSYAIDADAPIELRYVTMWILDGNDVGVEFTFDDGDFSFDSNYEWNYKPNRGLLGAANGGSVTQGDDQPMSLSFDGRFSKYKSASNVKPHEVLTGDSAGIVYVTSDTASCASYAVNIYLKNTPLCGDEDFLLFRDFRVESESFGIRDGKVSFSGKCNSVRPEVVGSIPGI